MYQSKTLTERHIMIFHNTLINNFENTLEISSCQQVDVTLLSTAAIKQVRCTWSRVRIVTAKGHANIIHHIILLLGRTPTTV